MDPVIKAELCKRLRSGEITQGRGRLKIADNGEIRMCCMGILSDIVDPDGWELDSLFDNSSSLKIYAHRGANGYPVAEVMEKAGLIKGQADLFLAGKNDTGMSFPEIADLIEKLY